MEITQTREFCEFVRNATSRHSKWYSVANDFNEHWTIAKKFVIQVPVSSNGTIPHKQNIEIEIPDEKDGIKLRNIVGDKRENVTKAWTAVLDLVGKQIANKIEGDFCPETQL